MLNIQSTSAANTGAANVNSGIASPAVKQKVVPEVVQLNRVNLKSLVVEQDGKFVSLTFIKQDGTTRTLTGRLGVKSYLKGGDNTVMAADRPYLTMFDIQLRQYRTVNLSTVSEIRAQKKIYRVID